VQQNPDQGLTIRCIRDIARGALYYTTYLHLLAEYYAEIRVTHPTTNIVRSFTMANQGRVKVGIIGSQFEADIHAASFQILPDEAEVVAVASPTPGHAEELAKKYGIVRNRCV
jgi:hypothetical protein